MDDGREKGEEEEEAVGNRRQEWPIPNLRNVCPELPVVTLSCTELTTAPYVCAHTKTHTYADALV